MKYMVSPSKTFSTTTMQMSSNYVKPNRTSRPQKIADDAENSGGAAETDKENVEVGGAQFGTCFHMKYMVSPSKTFSTTTMQMSSNYVKPNRTSRPQKIADDAENSGGAAETDKENVEVGGAQFGS